MDRTSPSGQKFPSHLATASRRHDGRTYVASLQSGNTALQILYLPLEDGNALILCLLPHHVPLMIRATIATPSASVCGVQRMTRQPASVAALYFSMSSR